MALTISFQERFDSRRFSLSNEDLTQEFDFYIYGNIYEEADVDATYGPDDDLVALEAAYSIIPPYRLVPLYDGTETVITLSFVEVSMIQHDVWRVDVRYGIPNNGGQLGGGYSADPGEVGPGVGDSTQWSNSFVSLNFNVSAEIQRKHMSLGTVACQKFFGATNTNVPYPEGKAHPIGKTADGTEGADVYVRQFGFGITAYKTPQQLTFAYVRRLFRMSCTKNNATFFGFPAGSVLFLESDATSDVFSVVPVNYSFKLRNNFKFSRTEVTTLVDPEEDDPALMFDTYNDPYFPDAGGGDAPGGAFSGWDDVEYLRTPKEINGAMVEVPYLRTIYRNYLYSNFANLEL